MKRSILILGIAAFVLLGCSAEDDPTPSSPDAGDDAGGMGGAGGTTGGAGGSTGGTGNTGGMGGSGDGGGMGGTGGSDDEDGGMEPVVDGGDEPMQPLPDDGNQGSVCADGNDCNQDLDCYNAGDEGQGFCSQVCEEDMDCEGIDGATYRCSMSTNVCIVDCEGEDDTESCPDAMVCLNTSAGGMPAFRCKYPDAPPPEGTQQAFEPCSDEEPCVGGLVCSGGGFGGDGYCTLECEVPDGDCSDVEDAAGDLTPECTAAFNGPGGGGEGRCTLDCSENEEGCPEGMACLEVGGPGGGGNMMRCGVE